LDFWRWCHDYRKKIQNIEIRQEDDMSDIIKELATIGRIQEAEVLKTYNLYNDTDTKVKAYFIEVSNLLKPECKPKQNISSADFVVARYQQSSSAKGNLYPNVPATHAKGVEGVLNALVRGLKNFLEYCPTIYPTCQKELAYQSMFWLLHYLEHPLHFCKVPCICQPKLPTSYTWFKDIAHLLSKELTKISVKGEKPYVGLAFNRRCMSEIYPELFKRKIFDFHAEHIEGDDFLNTGVGFGGNPELNFMTVDQLPKHMHGIKSKLLPIGHSDATYIKNGFQFFEKQMAFNLYDPSAGTNLKIGVLPTVLAEHEDKSVDDLYRTIYDIYAQLDMTDKKAHEKAELFEDNEDDLIYTISEVEEIAEYERNLPVINTFIIYEQSSSKRTMHGAIHDVLPSFILRQRELLHKYGLILFHIKDRKEPRLSLLFEDYVETFEVFYSHAKLSVERLMSKLEKVMLYGIASSAQAGNDYYPLINWGRLCNKKSDNKQSNYEESIRSPDVLVGIVGFLSEAGKLTHPLTLRKDNDMKWQPKESDSFESAVEQYLQNTLFLHRYENNTRLEAMYLLGMMSAALIRWQNGVMKHSSYGKWLNNVGVVDERQFFRVYTEFEKGYAKAKATSGRQSNCMIDALHEYFNAAYRPIEAYESQSLKEATLAFGFGVSDFKNIVKIKRTCKGKIVETEQEEITSQGEEL
jgi:hypothetical protein